MRPQQPITVSMQRHRITKTAVVHFTLAYISTQIHTHTLFLGLGVGILRTEGIACVLL